MNAPSRKMRTLAVAAVALVVVLALSAALLAFQAKSAVARIVEVLRPGYEITYVSPRVGLNGDLSVRELKVRPVGDDRATLTAVRAELRPSGPAWFLRAAFESGAALPPIEKLSLKLEGVAIEGSGDLHPSLRWIGTRSAAPFEGAGCGASIHFSAEDWEQLELGSGPASIDAEYAVTGPGLGTVTAAYAVPGSSRIEHRRVLKLDKPFEPLPLDPARAATVESQWAVIDEGFVTARNRLCARRARVARNHFADVHATAVRDWLRRLELEPSAGLIETYRRYALGGGELRWQSRPRAPIVFASYAAARADERVRVLAATLAATGKPAVAFELARVTPTVDPLDPAAALAGGDSAASPALADAGGAPASASAPGVDASASTEPTTPGTITAPTITPPPIAAPADPKPAVASAPAPSVPAPAAAGATVAKAPADAERAAPPASDRRDVAGTSRETRTAAATPAPAATPPPPREPADVVDVAEPAPASSAAVAANADPAPASAAAPPAAPPAKRPAARGVRVGAATFESLEHAVNRRIAVRTVNDTRRLGVLRGWTGAALTLEVSERNRHMQLKIPKDEIVRAEILDTATVPRRDDAKKN